MCLKQPQVLKIPFPHMLSPQSSCVLLLSELSSLHCDDETLLQLSVLQTFFSPLSGPSAHWEQSIPFVGRTPSSCNISSKRWWPLLNCNLAIGVVIYTMVCKANFVLGQSNQMVVVSLCPGSHTGYQDLWEDPVQHTCNCDWPIILG